MLSVLKKWCPQQLIFLFILSHILLHQDDGVLAFTSPIGRSSNRENLTQFARTRSLVVPSKYTRNSHSKLCLKATTRIPLSTAVATAAATRGIGSFFLTRILFLRGLAFVYFIAFLIAYRQNKGLIGNNGITPGQFRM